MMQARRCQGSCLQPSGPDAESRSSRCPRSPPIALSLAPPSPPSPPNLCLPGAAREGRSRRRDGVGDVEVE
eukprot:16264291-Heterocapsa_arctica.AAC.1